MGFTLVVDSCSLDHMRSDEKSNGTGKDTRQLELSFDGPPVSQPNKPLFPAAPAAALPVQSDERGYRGFALEREAAIRKFEQRFGLILNKPVRVTLVDVPGEFRGKLMLADLLPNDASPRVLHLRLADLEFTAADIESCSLLVVP
jgi:hypothetical protein